jgi:pSer/pThr/pTyr-binding forkhead associated (FHA) protein
MTTEARSSHRAEQLWSARARVAERDTRQLSSPHPGPVDAFDLLDHRTRESALLQDAAPSGRYLAIDDGDCRRLISLTRPITHIGRGLIADVRLEDPHVSRRHAIIAIRGDGPDAVRVLDDRSSDGTYVNGREVTVATLHDGDIVRVGRVAFRYTELDVVPARARARTRARAKRGGTLNAASTLSARRPRPAEAA